MSTAFLFKLNIKSLKCRLYLSSNLDIFSLVSKTIGLHWTHFQWVKCEQVFRLKSINYVVLCIQNVYFSQNVSQEKASVPPEELVSSLTTKNATEKCLECSRLRLLVASFLPRSLQITHTYLSARHANRNVFFEAIPYKSVEEYAKHVTLACIVVCCQIFHRTAVCGFFDVEICVKTTYSGKVDTADPLVRSSSILQLWWDTWTLDSSAVSPVHCPTFGFFFFLKR